MRSFYADPPRLICCVFVDHVIVSLLWSFTLRSLENYHSQPRWKLAMKGAPRSPVAFVLISCSWRPGSQNNSVWCA